MKSANQSKTTSWNVRFRLESGDLLHKAGQVGQTVATLDVGAGTT